MQDIGSRLDRTNRDLRGCPNFAVSSFRQCDSSMATRSQPGTIASVNDGKSRVVPSATPADDATTKALCDRVRDLRKRKAWTPEQLSAACGVSRSMLSEREDGRANPTLA